MEREVSWPGWEVTRLIGRGNFGTVYEIRRDVFGTEEKAALKVITIPQNPGDIEEMYSDGYDEASITSTFKSHLQSIVAEYTMMRKLGDCANIVHCEDVRYVQHDNGIGWDIFIKMELLTPLTKALPQYIPEESAIKLGKDMCNALEMCRAFNLVHRDIKPQNIFVSRNGDFKLGDFGVAKAVEKTMGGTKVGTYKYMAPEVYNNQPYGSGADIYSLGLVLYWMLNERRLPFLPLPPAMMSTGMDEAARNRRLSGEPIPEPKHGSRELKRIVLKACAYDPRMRYQSAGEMLQDLCVLTGEGVVQQEMEQGTVFCNYEEQTQVQKYAAYDTATVRQQYQLNDEQQTAWQQYQQEAVEPPPKKRGLKGLFIGIAAVVCVLALLLVAYFTVHVWEGPTCTRDAICKICTMTGRAATGHDWKDATCTDPKTCRDCGEERGEPADHQWEGGSCTRPSVCSECGKESDQVLGHNWQAASCTQARVCADCGETDGQALGHTWLAANCENPKTCTACGLTEGSALGHDWLPASFQAPKTCTDCGATEGSALSYKNVPVEDQVADVAEQYYDIEELEDNDKLRRVEVRDDIYYYYDTYGDVRKIVVAKGCDGLGSYSGKYSRSYYFTDGELIFAFFEGADAHRLYFYQGLLMRWRYQAAGQSNLSAVNEDFSFSEEFLLWERLALEEIQTFDIS